MLKDPLNGLLDASLDSWERSNVTLLNLLRAIPRDALGARAMPDSPTIGAMFAHLHHERMVSVQENAPECAGPVPATEWEDLRDPQQISERLQLSAACVRRAVCERIDTGRSLDRSFAHPIQLMHFLLFHDSYHHGQIKLALKSNGSPLSDALAGPLIWDVWRAR